MSVSVFLFLCVCLFNFLFYLFSRAVLEMQKSAGLHDLGLPKWQLVLCLLGVYTMLYLSLFKGVKSSGKPLWSFSLCSFATLMTFLVIRQGGVGNCDITIRGIIVTINERTDAAWSCPGNRLLPKTSA